MWLYVKNNNVFNFFFIAWIFFCKGSTLQEALTYSVMCSFGMKCVYFRPGLNCLSSFNHATCSQPHARLIRFTLAHINLVGAIFVFLMSWVEVMMRQSYR